MDKKIIALIVLVVSSIMLLAWHDGIISIDLLAVKAHCWTYLDKIVTVAGSILLNVWLSGSFKPKA